MTGQHADEEEIEKMIETGESETIFQKAILEQGRGYVMDTLAEIRERRDAGAPPLLLLCRRRRRRRRRVRCFSSLLCWGCGVTRSAAPPRPLPALGAERAERLFVSPSLVTPIRRLRLLCLRHCRCLQ